MTDRPKPALALIVSDSSQPMASSQSLRQVAELQELLRNLFDHVVKVQQLRDRMPTLRPAADPNIKASNRMSLYDLRRNL